MRPEDQVRGAPPPPPPPPPPGPPPGDIVREQDKIMLVFSYLFVLSLVPLLTVNDSEYVRWHAKNGLVLTLGGSVALSVLAALPIIKWVACPGWIVLIALAIVCIYRALHGVRLRIPVVTDIAEKF
jgi:uncharacterized membrane protein